MAAASAVVVSHGSTEFLLWICSHATSHGHAFGSCRWNGNLPCMASSILSVTGICFFYFGLDATTNKLFFDDIEMFEKMHRKM